ncbi:MAG: epoxyqueuosine reductase QueH, partial [Candidatus Omnitrophota bacterium]
LHICCGVCALRSIDRLREEGYSAEGLFFNPNIQPYSEYLKRKQAVIAAGQAKDIKITEGEYNNSDWLKICEPYAKEKEGQKRCFLCYEIRLKETFSFCLKNNFDYFTTTLTISPHKNSQVIIDLGKSIGSEKFLSLDFKKKEGFKKTIEKAKRLNLYRQNYCGCGYGKNNK